MTALNSGKMRNWQLVGFVSILSVCLVIGGFSGVAVAAGKGPIRIGFLAPLAGSRAQVGADMVDGFKMFLEEVNYTMEGRKVELFVEDHGTPDMAISKVRKLITHDKVDIVAGIFSTHVTYAVAPLCKEANIGLIITGAAGADVTQRKWEKNILRVNHASSQVGHVAGDYAYHHLGWRRAAILGWEHAFGQETIGAYQRVFEEAGGKVVQRIYAPRKTLDFGPYVGSLKRDADGLFAVITAAPAMRFFKTLRAKGFMDKWKVLTVLTATDESFLQQMGKTALGVLSVNSYSGALDIPENIKFREKVKKSVKREVTGPIMDAYVAADWVARAVKAVNGNVENRDRFMDALQAVEIPDSPHGHLKLDKYGNVIEDMYIRRVDKVGGRYQNTVIYTYPKVSQFWKYDPDTFVKEPLYTRNNPPCKYCK